MKRVIFTMILLAMTASSISWGQALTDDIPSTETFRPKREFANVRSYKLSKVFGAYADIPSTAPLVLAVQYDRDGFNVPVVLMFDGLTTQTAYNQALQAYKDNAAEQNEDAAVLGVSQKQLALFQTYRDLREEAEQSDRRLQQQLKEWILLSQQLTYVMDELKRLRSKEATSR